MRRLRQLVSFQATSPGRPSGYGRGVRPRSAWQAITLRPLRFLASSWPWRSLLYLGYCFKGRNNWRLAQRNFEEALQNLPANEDGPRKEILYQLATGSAEAGDYARALDLGNDLANRDFGYKDIGRLLDEWQSRVDQAKVS